MKNIYLVPHSHYDAVWAFTKEDYLFINIEKILRPVVQLMSDPGYRFLIEQTALLEVVERRNPSLFEDIRSHIQSGQIEIACGEYLMSDTMIPGGETLVRQILMGKRYAKEKFGIDIKVMWGADSFGYNAQMPQIYRQAGYEFFAFRHGAAKDCPTEFWWQGIDGSRILTHWMALGYRAGLYLDQLEQSYLTLSKCAATSHILMPSGSGSVPPQPETGRTVRRWNRTPRDSHMVIAKVEDFFRALAKETDTLEVRTGEQYSGRYSRVFPHSTSSRMWVKQNLRCLEYRMLATEKFVTMGWLLGLPYHSDEFGTTGRNSYGELFHDVIPGTGMDEGYEETRNNFEDLEIHLRSVLNDFLQVIQRNLTFSGDVIVFNPLSWDVKNWAEIELGFDEGVIKRISGLMSDKDEIEVEILEFSRYEDDSYRTVRLGFMATVPAFGFRNP